MPLAKWEIANYWCALSAISFGEDRGMAYCLRKRGMRRARVHGRLASCSVTCFKNHKDEFCQKIMPQEEINKSSLQEEATRSSGSLEDGTNCPNDKDQPPSLPPDITCLQQSPNTLCATKALEVEDPSWLVDRNRLRSLVELNEIRDALKDPELQKMVLKIDGSSEPERELEKLMEGQAFQQLTNKILDIVSPQQ